MPKSKESRTRISCLLGVVSLFHGLLALAAILGFEVVCSDFGWNLGIDSSLVEISLLVGSGVIAIFGIGGAFTAAAVAPSWKLRFGTLLPGAIICGFALFLLAGTLW